MSGPASARPQPFGRGPAAARLLAAAQMAALDAYAQERYALPVPVLMENAGRAAADLAQFLVGAAAGPGPAVRPAVRPAAGLRALAGPPRTGAGRVVLAAGKGNNGGDALCAARHLANRGLPVQVFLWADPAGLGPAPRAQWQALAAMADDGLLALTALDRGDLRKFSNEFAAACRDAALVVDGLLGIGAGGAPRPPYDAAVAVMNAARAPVLALDIPTGIDPDTGAVPGEAVRAADTLAFGWAKPGLFLFPAAEHAGRVWLGDLGIPAAAVDAWEAGPASGFPGGGLADAALADAATVAGWLAAAGVAPRRPAAHKGAHGRVAVVGGATGTHGAAVLAARGAMAAGAGLVTVLVPEGSWTTVARHLVEAMVRPVPADGGRFGVHSADAITRILVELRADAVCLGPGLGQGRGPEAVVRAVLEGPGGGADLRLTLDADGLNVLAGLAGDARRAALRALADREDGAVLTPHPGECARLLGTAVPAVEADRPAAANAAARAYGAVVALKGRPTIVAAPGGAWRLNPTGNPVLASGGTGDVLAGMVAAFLGHGMAAGPAAAAAVYVHGLAADLLAARGVVTGARARDVARWVPAALVRVAEAARP